MTVGVVVSRADEVSEHLAEHLLDLRDWEEETDESRPPEAGGGTVYRSAPFELRTFEDLHLSLEDVADAFGDPDLVAFASRHSGETGPLLTAHFTGNFGPAEYGGRDRELATAAPAALDRVLAAFDEFAPEGYDVGIECTHHGPTEVGAPSLFVELGSGPDQWADSRAARSVARAILSLEDVEESVTAPATAGGAGITDDGPAPEGTTSAENRTLVGVGGGHYARRFERLLRETDWRLGHVAADWSLDAMGNPRESKDVVRQAFERSGATRALVDGDHPEFEAVVDDLGYDVVGETWAREVDGVPLQLAEELENRLSTVEAGLRFGDPATGAEGDPLESDVDGGDYEVVELPDELLAEARSIDRERTRAAVDRTTIAFETAEGGTASTGRAAVTGSADKDILIGELLAVLADAYEAAERDGDVVRVRETGFDPTLARELGVPEGPSFGKLADGEPVEVDGRTVRPDEVTVERTREFPIQ